MKKISKLLGLFLLSLCMLFTAVGCTPLEDGGAVESSVTEEASQPESIDEEFSQEAKGDIQEDQSDALAVEEDGTYTSKDEVALYIHTYGKLPSNFISKTKARKAGWDSKEGNLDEVLPGMSIGGSQFKNYDGQLPDAQGRSWTECDINYIGGYRGAERIIFSNDGLVYYTDDHYETFEQLY